MVSPEPLLIYGGTFDPVHAGHVAVARAAADALGPCRVRVLPAGDPPHRAAPRAAAVHRTAMLQLAFAGDPRFVIDPRELQRRGPSYSVDTLRELRAEVGADLPLLMLLGRDAANGLASWHEASALPALAHLLVIARRGADHNDAVERTLGWRRAPRIEALATSPSGLCWQIDEPVSALSSTAVRGGLAARGADRDALAPAVAEYIARHGLYR